MHKRGTLDRDFQGLPSPAPFPPIRERFDTSEMRLDSNENNPPTRRKPLIYLAGPFFNDAQKKLIEQIELILAQYASNYDVYSPRYHSGSDLIPPEKRSDPEAWNPVFESNVDAIERCQFVLAVLDYRLPQFHTLRLIEQKAIGVMGEGKVLDVNHGVVSIPDTGTIYEIGYATARNKSIVGFYEEKPNKMNLMLAKTANGFIYGLDDLQTIMSNSNRNTELSYSGMHFFDGAII